MVWKWLGGISESDSDRSVRRPRVTPASPPSTPPSPSTPRVLIIHDSTSIVPLVMAFVLKGQAGNSDHILTLIRNILAQTAREADVDKNNRYIEDLIRNHPPFQDDPDVNAAVRTAQKLVQALCHANPQEKEQCRQLLAEEVLPALSNMFNACNVKLKASRAARDPALTKLEYFLYQYITKLCKQNMLQPAANLLWKMHVITKPFADNQKAAALALYQAIKTPAHPLQVAMDMLDAADATALTTMLREIEPSLKSVASSKAPVAPLLVFGAAAAGPGERKGSSKISPASPTAPKTADEKTTATPAVSPAVSLAKLIEELFSLLGDKAPKLLLSIQEAATLHGANVTDFRLALETALNQVGVYAPDRLISSNNGKAWQTVVAIAESYSSSAETRAELPVLISQTLFRKSKQLLQTHLQRWRDQYLTAAAATLDELGTLLQHPLRTGDEFYKFSMLLHHMCTYVAFSDQANAYYNKCENAVTLVDLLKVTRRPEVGQSSKVFIRLLKANPVAQKALDNFWKSLDKTRLMWFLARPRDLLDRAGNEGDKAEAARVMLKKLFKKGPLQFRALENETVANAFVGLMGALGQYLETTGDALDEINKLTVAAELFPTATEGEIDFLGRFLCTPQTSNKNPAELIIEFLEEGDTDVWIKNNIRPALFYLALNDSLCTRDGLYVVREPMLHVCYVQNKKLITLDISPTMIEERLQNAAADEKEKDPAVNLLTQLAQLRPDKKLITFLSRVTTEAQHNAFNAELKECPLITNSKMRALLLKYVDPADKNLDIQKSRVIKVMRGYLSHRKNKTFKEIYTVEEQNFLARLTQSFVGIKPNSKSITDELVLGEFFINGPAFLTDVSKLVMAAISLAVRDVRGLLGGEFSDLGRYAVTPAANITPDVPVILKRKSSPPTSPASPRPKAAGSALLSPRAAMPTAAAAGPTVITASPSVGKVPAAESKVDVVEKAASCRALCQASFDVIETAAECTENTMALIPTMLAELEIFRQAVALDKDTAAAELRSLFSRLNLICDAGDAARLLSAYFKAVDLPLPATEVLPAPVSEVKREETPDATCLRAITILQEINLYHVDEVRNSLQQAVALMKAVIQTHPRIAQDYLDNFVAHCFGLCPPLVDADEKAFSGLQDLLMTQLAASDAKSMPVAPAGGSISFISTTQGYSLASLRMSDSVVGEHKSVGALLTKLCITPADVSARMEMGDSGARGTTLPPHRYEPVSIAKTTYGS